MSQYIFVNRFFYPDHSATSQILTDLAFFLASEQKSVTVVTSRQLYGDATAQLPSAETVKGVHVVRVRTTEFGRGKLVGRVIDYASFYLAAFAVLLRLVRTGDVIIAKTDPPMVSVVCALAAGARGALLVNWLQDLFPEVATALGIRIGRFPTSILCRIRNWSLRRAVVNVAIGELMAKRLRDARVPEHQVVVIPNWSDGLSVKPVPVEENPLREAWGVHRKFVVGYSGNMGRVHEFDTIVQAAERLRDCEHIRFVFVGDGPRKHAVQEEVARRELNNFIWQPYQDRHGLAQSLSVADLHFVSLRPEIEGLVVPSKYYGIAAAGRAALFIGDTGGEVARILADRHCGRAFEIGDVEGVAKFISAAAADPVATAAMGRNARAAFEREFDQNGRLLAWSSLLQNVAAGVGRKPVNQRS